jgi:hypothetical protein
MSVIDVVFALLGIAAWIWVLVEFARKGKKQR